MNDISLGDVFCLRDFKKKIVYEIIFAMMTGSQNELLKEKKILAFVHLNVYELTAYSKYET